MSRSTILRLLSDLALILLLTTLPAAAQTAARTLAVNTSRSMGRLPIAGMTSNAVRRA